MKLLHKLAGSVLLITARRGFYVLQEAEDDEIGDINLPKSLKYQACSGKRLR